MVVRLEHAVQQVQVGNGLALTGGRRLDSLLQSLLYFDGQLIRIHGMVCFFCYGLVGEPPFFLVARRFYGCPAVCRQALCLCLWLCLRDGSSDDTDKNEAKDKDGRYNGKSVTKSQIMRR